MDIINIKTPKSIKLMSIKNIKKGVQRTPLFIFKGHYLSAELPLGTQSFLRVDLLEPSTL
jgi:hypothetical protein